MSKLSIILNALVVVISLVAFGLTQSAVSKHQEDLGEIEDLKKKIEEAEKNLETQKSESASKFIRQENRNQDISEEILEFKKSHEEVLATLENVKLQIGEIEESIDEAQLAVTSSDNRKMQVVEELILKQTEVQNLRNEIPKIDQQIENKKFEIREFEEKSNELVNRLSVYSTVTSILRQHYIETVSAIRSYARIRPWLEPGEELNVRLGPVDLKSGYIALSEGGEAGLRENMVFAVHALGEEISKIRIKRVYRTYALAELIPLVGNPLKLQTISEVDLVAL